MMVKDLLSIVIPCYNSEKTIAHVVEKEMHLFQENGIHNYEFILINDCSKDGTWQQLTKLAKKYSFIKCINLAKNVGQHGAIMAGFNHISGDRVVLSDDDGQTQMDLIGDMYRCMDEGYDVVMVDTSMREEKVSLFRKVGTRVNNFISTLLLNNPDRIPLSIFLMAKRFIVDEIIQYKNPYPYITGLVFRTTHNIGIIQGKQLKRLNGQSGYSFKKLLGLWFNGLTAFSIAPLRIASYIGFISALIGFVYGIYLLIRKLIWRSIIPVGWSSTIAIVLFMSGIILFVLGMIGEYIGRIYMCINQTPQFTVKETVNIERQAGHE